MVFTSHGELLKVHRVCAQHLIECGRCSCDIVSFVVPRSQASGSDCENTAGNCVRIAFVNVFCCGTVVTRRKASRKLGNTSRTIKRLRQIVSRQVSLAASTLSGMPISLTAH